MPTALVIHALAMQPSGSPTIPSARLSTGASRAGAPPQPADLVVVRAVRTDEARLRFRYRQLELGKASPEYLAYVSAVPKEEREANCAAHPVTPRAEDVCSKRTFDAFLKIWRRALHTHWEVAGGSSSVSRSSSEAGEDRAQEKKLWKDFKGSWASECDEDPDFRDFDGEEC